MRKSCVPILLPLLLAGCHPSESFVEAFSSGTNPVLDSAAPRPGGMADFHFHAADGNVVVLHRDILESRQPRAPLDVGLDIDPARQKAGTTFTDHWSCEGQTGRERISAYLIDANHHHSNPVEYTVDCGG